MNTTKTIGTLLAGVALSLASGLAGPAEATAPASVTRATYSCGTCVAPITCLQEDSCVLDFVGNYGKGYWRARQDTGSTWVRLTMVNGQ